MKLIVLYGPEDSGKTTTLEIVYERLKRISIPRATNMFWYLDGIQRDFIDVLNIDKKRLGEDGCNPSERNPNEPPELVKIGIVTQGDYVKGSNAIDEHLTFLLGANCDIAICPCSKILHKSKTPAIAIEEFIKANATIVIRVKTFKIKPYSNELQIANEILRELKKHC